MYGLPKDKLINMNLYSYLSYKNYLLVNFS